MTEKGDDTKMPKPTDSDIDTKPEKPSSKRRKIEKVLEGEDNSKKQLVDEKATIDQIVSIVGNKNIARMSDSTIEALKELTVEQIEKRIEAMGRDNFEKQPSGILLTVQQIEERIEVMGSDNIEKQVNGFLLTVNQILDTLEELTPEQTNAAGGENSVNASKDVVNTLKERILEFYDFFRKLTQGANIDRIGEIEKDNFKKKLDDFQLELEQILENVVALKKLTPEEIKKKFKSSEDNTATSGPDAVVEPTSEPSREGENDDTNHEPDAEVVPTDGPSPETDESPKVDKNPENLPSIEPLQKEIQKQQQYLSENIVYLRVSWEIYLEANDLLKDPSGLEISKLNETLSE